MIAYGSVRCPDHTKNYAVLNPAAFGHKKPLATQSCGRRRDQGGRMSEALKARERAARREYPETKAAFDRVRAAAVESLFASPPGEAARREELYRTVQLLERVERELLTAMGSEAIEDYVAGLGGSGE